MCATSTNNSTCACNPEFCSCSAIPKNCFKQAAVKSTLGSGIWQLEAVDFMTSQDCFSGSWFVSTVSRAATLSTSKVEEVHQDEGIVRQR